MIEWTRITQFGSACSERVGGLVQTMRTQPNWAMRMALMAAALVILVPVILLVMIAIMFAVVVFGVLAGVNVIMMKLRRLLPRNDGRENVRVIRRVEQTPH